ncbi:MAG: transposase [Chitinivibrionales bacterium]|nr:transposase [Chitinivibrionales bacterium]MBD3357738.1 transposase [Chitinivibrionales bacterium]
MYEQLNTGDAVIHVGCGAHARRYFKEAQKNHRGRARPILDLWQSLFKIEKTALHRALSAAQRLELRREHSAPLMARLKTLLDGAIGEVTPKSGIGKAVAYLLNRWKQLTHFLQDGRIELSNNLIENRVRPFALGRKNWLFVGSEVGAKRLATAYTVLGTCLLNDSNPFNYCYDVLDKLPARDAKDIDDLLPLNWKSSNQ